MIPLERLAAHALGDLDERESAAVDEHVLGCSACAAKLERLLAMGDAVRDLVKRGGVRVAVTPSTLDHLRREGLVSRAYRIRPNETVPCTVGEDDVYVLVELEVDFAGAGRVDLDRAGLVIRDLPKDRARGQVAFVSPAEIIRGLPSGKIPLTLRDGQRTLATYELDHTAYSRDGSPGSRSS